METTLIIRKCPMCGEERSLPVSLEAYGNWRGGMLIQDAFPDLSPSDREHLQTGICQSCWNTLEEPGYTDEQILMDQIFSGFGAQVEAQNEIAETEVEVEQDEVDVELACDLLNAQMDLAEDMKSFSVTFRGVTYRIRIEREP